MVIIDQLHSKGVGTRGHILPDDAHPRVGFISTRSGYGRGAGRRWNINIHVIMKVSLAGYGSPARWFESEIGDIH